MVSRSVGLLNNYPNRFILKNDLRPSINGASFGGLLKQFEIDPKESFPRVTIPR